MIRHIGKLTAIRDNAIAWQNMKAHDIDMVNWLWDFVYQQVQLNDVPDYKLAPAQTETSQKLSKALKKERFLNLLVQPLAMPLCKQWAMVNDHENDCISR